MEDAEAVAKLHAMVSGAPGEPVPKVDPEDVKTVWKLGQEVKTDHPGGGVAIGMAICATEFLRRFFLHVLPKGFVRIRHFGFLASRFRASLWRLPDSCWPPGTRQSGKLQHTSAREFFSLALPPAVAHR